MGQEAGVSQGGLYMDRIMVYKFLLPGKVQETETAVPVLSAPFGVKDEKMRPALE